MITTVSGNNDFEKYNFLKKYIESHSNNNGPYSYHTIDLDDFDLIDLASRLTSTNLFSNNDLYVLKTNSLDSRIVKFLEEIIASYNNENEIIIIINKIDNKTTIAKLLKSKTNMKLFSQLNQADLIKWIIDYVSSKDGDINSITARYLIDNVSQDQFNLSNELDKLILFDKHISDSSVDNLSEKSLNKNIFDLIDAIFNKKPNQAIMIYDQLRNFGNSPYRIIATLSWALFNINIIKLAKEQSINQIANDSGIKTSVLNRSNNTARLISFTDLKKIIDSLILIDIKSKKIKYSIDQALKVYFLDISQKIR